MRSDYVSVQGNSGMSIRRPFSTTRPIKSRHRLHLVQTKAVYKVDIEHSGKSYSLDVPEGESILSVAVDKYKLDLPHGMQL
jgi:hypothetical protein